MPVCLVSRIARHCIASLLVVASLLPLQTVLAMGSRPENQTSTAPSYSYWTAQRGTSRLVLIGELHTLAIAPDAIPDSLIREIEAAGALGFEYTTSPQHSVLWDRKGRRLSDRLGPDRYASVLALLTESERGLLAKAIGGLNRFDHLNPGMAGATLFSVVGHQHFSQVLASRSPPSPDQATMTQHVLRRQNGREVLYLDSDESIGELWDACSCAEELQSYLAQSIEDGRAAAAELSSANAQLGLAIKSGQYRAAVEAHERLLRVPSQSTFQRCAAEPRNRFWVARMEEHLKVHSSLVYVGGLGHFLGERSVLRLLEKAGFKVTLVAPSP